MSDVDLIKIADMQNELRPGADASPDAWSTYRMWLQTAGRIDGNLSRLTQILGKELTFGVPSVNAYADYGVGLGNPVGVPDNIEGQWCGAVLNDPAMLGAGVLAPIVFTHGLDVPVLGAVGAPFPNVRWPIVHFLYGFLGAVAAPPLANPTHHTLHFNSGDAVTNNSIALRIHSNAVIGVLAPLFIDVFFVRAVQ